MVKKNSIPDGWRTVTPIGHPVPGTRFIAFKVPLKGAVNQRLTPTQKFTPKDLISAIKALNVELGLIIDLTYTTRYYEVKDLPKSIHYKKLYTVGLEVPDNATILQFKKWVRKFLWENAENGKLIGVHCTNGINRTGYLICRYLIDVEGWDPDTAIQVILEWMSGILMKMQISHLILWKTLKIGPQMKTFMGLGKGQDILMTSTLEMIHRDHGTDNCRSKSQRPRLQDRNGVRKDFSLLTETGEFYFFIINLFFIGVQFANIQNNTQCSSRQVPPSVPVTHSPHPPPSSPSTTPSSFPRVRSLYKLVNSNSNLLRGSV
ncbi:RNA/RNP complex-1-interacting phosphatase homolog isoform X2 [Canis lupus familiaris]|uniref:RNA/RNP complex-1-interacting phosphatase homolog isoform X2 n=1 Tax=Canis lupus familiaris TaxID=9615 RepID=UPI0018F638D0|nr:RNA/RNP complex-1-interacting phosphatase homolog isoform X2 [Canis lupus familiaris]XP_038316174.1 RNA/RNP complex-1-interacting phosphatase homolog isoform X2 [Canis lupus familiaris]XP_038434288.1 RNA/RNP complex-1-interacting phosphatase homolog isoform X2 [Canis lupus familiaris]